MRSGATILQIEQLLAMSTGEATTTKNTKQVKKPKKKKNENIASA